MVGWYLFAHRSIGTALFDRGLRGTGNLGYVRPVHSLLQKSCLRSKLVLSRVEESRKFAALQPALSSGSDVERSVRLVLAFALVPYLSNAFS